MATGIEKKFTMYFMQALNAHDGYYSPFVEALSVAKSQSSGRIWCIGGAIYRPIVHRLYGTKQIFRDYDFLTDELVPSPLPDGWKKTRKTSYGSPRFSNGTIDVTVIPFKELYSIRRRNLPCDIGHFLSGVPLTVQSIVFDVAAWSIKGDVGIGSIQDRTVGVNDPDELKFLARRRWRRQKTIVAKKAESLGFKSIWPIPQ